MNGGHHDLAPSSFPAWAVCPCFESDPAERADAAEGTAQHAALAAALSGDETPLQGLSPDARAAVTWAADHVRTLAGSDQINCEVHLQYTAPDAFARGGSSKVYHGTADALVLRGNLADLIDYKSGADDRDHRPQLAGYALAVFSMRARIKTVRCHVLYGRVHHVDSWALTQAAAAGTVLPLLDARRDPARAPSTCDYCSFCRDRITCPALTAQVEAVARTAPAWEDLAPAIRDPGAITDPALAAKALTVARFVATWADAVRKAATDLAKGGAVLPGYRLQERRGTREVTDLDAAFTRTGLIPAQFVAACNLSLPKLAEAFAGAREMSKAQAGREIEGMLADLIREGTPSVFLVVDRKGRE
ncbi:DUF2800 domain-containing protein [Verrucomicrobiota bacterium]